MPSLPFDIELQAPLAAAALHALDQLLTAQPPGETIATDGVGAIIRLITQASDAAERA